MADARMDRRKSLQTAIAALVGVARMDSCSTAAEFEPFDGQVPPDDATADESVDVVVPETGTPTLGGIQFWGDVAFLRNWKIQQNAFTGDYRLLDPDNNRFGSGTREHCEALLHAVRKKRKLTADTGRAVILIHGIGRSSRSFSRMQRVFRADGYVVVPFEYPSTRVSLERSAELLSAVLQSVDGVTSIDFVVHSMGGLVVRACLQRGEDDRFHRMVMLGTPNRGAEIADLLQRTTLFKLIYGPAGQELVTGADDIISRLPVPRFEFGVIAGGNGTVRGYNPLLPGDNDGTVTVESARLSGAADFLRVPRLHSLLMNDDQVVAATRHFLKHGRFDPDRPRAPVP